MWENSVQPCTTEVWLNHVLWWKQKPSGNYKRSGISLLPGTCKFSFSFKLRAVWRMKEGPPLQGSCCCSQRPTAQPHTAPRSWEPHAPLLLCQPPPRVTTAEKIHWTPSQKGGEKAAGWYYPLSGLHLWHTLMGSSSPQNWEIMKPRKIYIQHFQRRLNTLWNIQEQFKCKYGTVLYYSYSATFCFSGLIGRRSFPVCFLLV